MKVVAKYPSGGERRDIYGLDGGCRTLSATDYKQPVSVVIPVLTPERANKRQNGRRFKDAGEESFTLTAIDRHGVALGINIQGDNIVGETDTAHCLNANDQRKVFGAHQERTLIAMPCIIDEDISPTCIGGFGEKKSNGGSQYYQQDRVYDGTKLATALATNLPGGANNYSFPIVALSYETTDDPDIIVANLGDFKVPAIWYEKYQCYIAIRKLTPKECFILQGWTEDYFEKAAFMNSDSQLYKQAGNGITVNVVEVIAQKISPEKPLTFVDLFAGIGGFRRGMELAGHNCVGFCEWDKYARASYISMHCITEEQRNYLSTLNMKQRQKEILNDEYLNGEWTATDICGVTGESIPKVDCWGFGAPCQSFSIAGRRAGLDGESGLIQEVFRILGEIEEESRPEWIIYENVKGMFSSNKGFDYLAILLAMDELGYDVEWQLFNSKDWGVPQNRERVYTIGHLRCKGRRKILPIGITNEENNIPVKQIGRDGTATNRDNPNQYRVYDTKGICPTLNTMGGGGREPMIPVEVIIDNETVDK